MPYFITVEHSGKALDVTGGSSDDGVVIQQYPFHNGTNQLWEIIPLARDPSVTYPGGGTPGFYSGPYLIVAVHSSKAWDDWYANLEIGADIRQSRVHGGANQQWMIDPLEPHPATLPLGESARYFITNVWNQRVVDVRGGSMEDHAPIQLWDRHGGPNQQFRIHRI